jgi:hypothetical protein
MEFKYLLPCLILGAVFIFFTNATLNANFYQSREFEEDVIKTRKGDLKITFIGHGTLMLTFADKIIHIDPWSSQADYSIMPKADLILVTHEHGDHLDAKAIEIITKENTDLVYNEACAEKVKKWYCFKKW